MSSSNTTTTTTTAVAAAAATATNQVEAAAAAETVPPPAAPPVTSFGGTSLPEEAAPEGVVEPGLENTGRWTKQEHALFLQGIEKYGKEWKKVAAFCRTRTVMQTRTHAQKYYEKLAQVALKGGVERKERKGPLVPAPPVLVSPVPVLHFTDLDILVPINDTTATRPANQEYMDLMKANCFIFHALPLTEQLWFARNIVHFLSTVRHHRWIGCHYYGTQPQYQLLTEPVSVVQSDFRMDPLKVAAFSFHPFWLLGEHDLQDAHDGQPFVHRTVNGSWKPVTMAQVRDILKGEGPKNLLLLPPNMHWTEAAAAVEATAVEGTAAATTEQRPAAVETVVEATTAAKTKTTEKATTRKATPAKRKEEEEDCKDDDEENENDDKEEAPTTARRSKRQRL